MFIIKNNMDNHFLNTFATRQEYEAYIASEAAMFPNYAYIEATDEVIKVFEEEHIPVFSIKVLDGWGDEYSDGATIEGGGETLDLLSVEGYLDGEQISTDDFSVTANNGLVFTDGTTSYQAELPYGYDSTYNYTITATCSGQTVTFRLTYVQPESEYRLILSVCQDPSEGDWCIKQGFCGDNDYFVLLMDGDTIATYDGQTVEYESWGETYHPQLIDPSAGTCVWNCPVVDPSITEVVCYDSDNNIIATLETSCE